MLRFLPSSLVYYGGWQNRLRCCTATYWRGACSRGYILYYICTSMVFYVKSLCLFCFCCSFSASQLQGRSVIFFFQLVMVKQVCFFEALLLKWMLCSQGRCSVTAVLEGGIWKDFTKSQRVTKGYQNVHRTSDNLRITIMHREVSIYNTCIRTAVHSGCW